MNVYTFETNGKINKDTTISLLSDFHFNDNTSEKRIAKVTNSLEKVKPNYIFLLGDIVQDTNISNGLMNKINAHLNNITDIAPTYLVYGNHDIQTKKNGKWTRSTNEDYYSMLNDINNLNVLDNESIKLDENIGITGVNLPFGYYNILHENSEKYLQIFNDYLNKKLLGNLDNESYNILLQHTPNNISNKEIYIEILKKIKIIIQKDFNFNLIISGHLHNGLVPSYIDKFIPSNRGIIGITDGKIDLFKDNCRGINKVTDDTTCIILPAVNSLPEYPLLNKFFPANNKTLVLKK